VLPSFIDNPFGFTAGLSSRQSIEKLRNAISNNAADLCALTGTSLEGCNVELKDLGVASGSVSIVDEGSQLGNVFVDNMLIIVYCAAALGVLAASCMFYYMIKFYKAKMTKKANKAPTTAAEASAAAESKVTASMEEGKTPSTAFDEKKLADDQSDNNSTLAPSSDKQSDASVNGDAEDMSSPDLSVVKALSEQSI